MAPAVGGEWIGAVQDLSGPAQHRRFKSWRRRHEEDPQEEPQRSRALATGTSFASSAVAPPSVLPLALEIIDDVLPPLPSARSDRASPKIPMRPPKDRLPR